MQYHIEPLSSVLNTSFDYLSEPTWDAEKTLEYGRSVLNNIPAGLFTKSPENLLIDGSKRIRAIKRIFSKDSGFSFDTILIHENPAEALVYSLHDNAMNIPAHHLASNTEAAELCRILKTLNKDIDEGDSADYINHIASYFTKIREIQLVFATVETDDPQVMHESINAG